MVGCVCATEAPPQTVHCVTARQLLALLGSGPSSGMSHSGITAAIFTPTNNRGSVFFFEPSAADLTTRIKESAGSTSTRPPVGQTAPPSFLRRAGALTFDAHLHQPVPLSAAVAQQAEGSVPAGHGVAGNAGVEQLVSHLVARVLLQTGVWKGWRVAAGLACQHQHKAQREK